MSKIDLHGQELSVEGMIDDIVMAEGSTHPKRFCFVLGAGASRSSGIRSGQEMVKIWDEKLRERNPSSHEKWLAEKGINPDNMAGFYSDFYDRRYGRQPEDGYAFMEKEMEHAKPSLGYIMLADILAHTPHNVVITTNFDRLVEKALSEYTHTMPMVVGHEAIAHHVRLPICRPTIIKIHRDLLLDPKSEGAQLKTLDPKWEQPLGKIFESYHPIFVGYAGNDPSLMDFLNANSKRFASNEWKLPYWTLYGDEPIRDKVEGFLQGSVGYYTRCTGFDDLMCLIGATLDCKLPKKEAYIEDITKRHDALMAQYETFIAAQRKQPVSTPPQHTATGETTNNTTTSASPSGTPVSGVDKAVGQALEKIAGENDSQRRYSEAVNLYYAGKYKEAEAILQSLVNGFPENDRYLNALGAALDGMGRYQEAVDAYNKAIALNSDDEDYYANLGLALCRLERYHEAVDAYNEAIVRNPGDANCYANLGLALRRLKRYHEAVDAYKKAVELDPDDGVYYSSLGFVLTELGYYQDAVDAYDQAIALNPEEGNYHANLADALNNLGRHQEAMDACKKAIALNPNIPHYYYNLGDALRHLERYPEAKEAYEKARALAPDDPAFQNPLA